MKYMKAFVLSLALGLAGAAFAAPQGQGKTGQDCCKEKPCCCCKEGAACCKK